MSCVGLAGVVMLEINNGLPLATDVHATSLLDAPLSIPEQGPPILDPLPKSIVADITSKPLFDADRKPSEQRMEAMTSEEQALKGGSSPGLELAGTLLTDKIGAALILDETRGAHRLQIGQTIAGWRIEMVAKDSIHVRRYGKMQQIMLRRDGAERHIGD